MGVLLGVVSWLIHIVVESCIWVLVWWTRFSRFVRRMFRGSRRSIDETAIRAASGQIRHVAAVLPNGEISLDDAVFLCRLLLASSAEWITVYQEHGSLKARQEEIFNLLQPCSGARLHFLDTSDCEGGLVRAVQEVGALAEDEITAKEISKRLPIQCPDVDLALCFDGPRRNGL